MIDKLAPRDHEDRSMQSTRRADMTRNRQQFVSWLKFVRARRLQHEVFFVLQDLLGIGQVGKHHALPSRRIRRDCFVTEVQSDSIGGRTADDSRQHHSSGGENQIGKVFRVANVVEHTSTGAELDRRVVDLGVDRKRGCASADHTRHRLSRRDQVVTKRSHLVEFRQDGDSAFVSRELMLMSVVNVKATRIQSASRRDLAIQLGRMRADRDARPMLPDVDVQQHVNSTSGRVQRFTQ